MTKQTYKKAERIFRGAAFFVVLCGVISYLTANGHAVMGPDPVNIEAQRTGIAINTAWWVMGLIVVSLIMSLLASLDPKGVSEKEN